MSAAPTLPPLARSGKVTGWMIRRAKWWQELSSGCSSPRGASALGSLRRRLQLPNHIRAETYPDGAPEIVALEFYLA